MKIEVGYTYYNKTSVFLLPIFNTMYSSTLVRYLNATSILAWGLYDILYLEAKQIKEMHHCVFLLQDINGGYNTKIKKYYNIKEGRLKFNAFLKNARKNKYFIDDYIYNHLNIANRHMTIFRLPEEYYNSWEKFTQSKYSEMYTQKQLGKVKINRGSDAWKILTKDEGYREVFLNRLNAKFGTTLTLRDIEEHSELEPPIEFKAEVFNYIKQ